MWTLVSKDCKVVIAVLHAYLAGLYRFNREEREGFRVPVSVLRRSLGMQYIGLTRPRPLTRACDATPGAERHRRSLIHAVMPSRLPQAN